MVKYISYINHSWEGCLSTTYKQRKELEGERMYSTYVKHDYNHVDLVIQKPDTILVNLLDKLIQEKVEEFLNFAKKTPRFMSRAEWLIKWSQTTKDELLTCIKFSINSKSVKDDKLANFIDLIARYHSYFELVENESDDVAKFEELFNTVVQIPDEVIYYFNIDKNIFGNSKIIPNHYTAKNSILIESSIKDRAYKNIA